MPVSVAIVLLGLLLSFWGLSAPMGYYTGCNTKFEGLFWLVLTSGGLWGLVIAIGSNLDDIVAIRIHRAIVVCGSLGLNALKPPVASPVAFF